MVKSCDGSRYQVLGHNIVVSIYMLDQDLELQEELLIELSFVGLSIIDSYPQVVFQCLSIFQFTSHDFHVHFPPISSCIKFLIQFFLTYMQPFILYKEAKRYVPSHILVMNKDTQYILEMEDKYI